MKLILKNTCFFVLFALSSNYAFAYPTNFIGTWKNLNPNTRGIVKLIITPGPIMRMYGACTPTPCDNGTTSLITFGNNVSDLNHKVAVGHFNLNFKKIGTTLKLLNNNRLSFEHFNQFTDSSGRQNYWMTENFKKVLPYNEE